MARVTSKRQVTIPKAVADRYGIAAGDELVFVPAGAAIRVARAGSPPGSRDLRERLRRFDQATERQRAREHSTPREVADRRDWRREDLYQRGSAR